MNFSDVISAVTAEHSGYAVAKKLGISSQMFYRYKNNGVIPSDETLDKMAKIANLPPVQVYLAAYAEKLGNPEIAAQFRTLATH